MHISTKFVFKTVIFVILVSIFIQYSTCLETELLWKLNQPEQLLCEFNDFDTSNGSQWYKDDQLLLVDDRSFNISIRGNASVLNLINVPIDYDQSEISCRYLNDKKCVFKIYLYDDPQKYKGNVTLEIDTTEHSVELSSSTLSPDIPLMVKDPYNYTIIVTYIFEALPLSQLLINGDPIYHDTCNSSIGLKCLKTVFLISSFGVSNNCPAKRLNYGLSFDYGNATVYQNLSNPITFNTNNISILYAPIIELRNVPSEARVNDSIKPLCHVKCSSSRQDWIFHWYMERLLNNSVTSKKWSEEPSTNSDNEIKEDISGEFDKIKFVCSVKNGVFDGSSYSIDTGNVKRIKDTTSDPPVNSGINIPLGAIIGIAVGIFAVFVILIFVVRYAVLPHFYFIKKA